jgi:hypothetical protein
MRARLSYANVTATLALFVALGGTSYAAVKITGKNVKNRSLTGADVRSGSLTGTQIKNGSLSRVEFKFAPPAAGAAGPKGEPGAAGAIGPAGAAGPGSAAKGIAIEDQPISLKAGGEFQTLAELHSSTTQSGALVFTGAVEETAGADEARVQLQVVHNGHAHLVPSRGTIGAGDSGVGLVSLLCNESPGPLDVQLQGRATGAAVDIGPRNFAMAETVHLP